MALGRMSSRQPSNDETLHRQRRYHGVYMGVVRDNKDAQHMGRLRVWVDVFGGDLDDPASWVTASYCSPFAGATDYDAVSIGGPDRPENSQTSYGFWAVPPDINNTVIIMFINGDPSRAIWIGSLYQQKLNRMVPGIPHGKSPNTDDPRPVTEHNRKTNQAITEDTPRAEILDSMSAGIKRQGLIQDHARGVTDSGARRETPSEVYGLLTPGPVRDDTASSSVRQSRMGGHQLVLDDGPAREKVRIRTRQGAQVLLDDSNGMVYLCNTDGTAWIQMDADGRVDIYGAQSIAMRSERDVLVRADRDIVFEAGRDIAFKANADWQEAATGSQHAGEGQGEGGNIMLHANNNLDTIVANDHRITVNRDMRLNVGRDRDTVVGQNDTTQVEQNAFLTVNQEDYRVTVNGDYLRNVGGDASLFAGNDIKLQAWNDMEQFAYQGKIDFGSNLNISVKSKKGDVSVVAEDAKGVVSLSAAAAQTQLVMKNPLMRMFSAGKILFQSTEEVDVQVNEEFGVDSGGSITKGGTAIDGGCLRFDGGVNVSFTGKEIKMDAVDDIAQKLQNKFDKAGNPIATGIENINDKFENLEDKFNELSNWTGEYVSELWGKLDGLGVGNLPLSLNLPFPVLPQFPQLPSLTLPALNLPNLPFDFCIEIGELISIDQYNPIPNGLFGTVNVDLGGWTRSNIGGWFGRQRAGFDRMVQGLNIANQVLPQIREATQQVRGNVNQIKNSLKNLASPSVVLSSNGSYYRDYSVGLQGLSDNLDVLSRQAATNPAASAATASIVELQNDVTAHSRTVEQINKLVEQNPGALDGLDYTELEEVALFFEELEQDLDAILDGTYQEESGDA